MRTIQCFPLFAVLTLFPCPPAWAQPSPGPSALTLAEAVVLSLNKNPDREIAAADLAAAGNDLHLAKTALLPNFSFSETATRGNDPVYVFGTRLRQQRFTQNDFALDSLNRPTPIGDFTTQFSGHWTVFDFWRTELAIRRASLLQKSTQASAVRSDQEIVRRVVAAYEGILYAQKQFEIAQHQVETASALLDSSQSHVEAGVAVEADRLSAATNLDMRQQELIAGEGDLAIAWAELERAIGAPIPDEQRRLQTIVEKHFDRPALAAAVAAALRTRPDRKSLQEQLQAGRAEVSAEKSAFAPTVSTYGSWQADRGSFAGAGGNSWIAGAELRVDILPLAHRHEVAAAQIAEERTRAASASADNQIRMEVTRAWYAQQAASRMIEVARASQAQSEESLRILRNRYDAGLATITDLLRAEDAERQSATSYWQAVYRNALAWVDLKFATGALTPANLEDLQ